MRKFVLLVMGVLLLSACDGMGNVAEATPTVAPIIEMSQVFSGSPVFGGTLTVKFPSTWYQGGTADQVLLADAPSILQHFSADLVNDQAAASITFIPNDLAGLSVAEGTTVSATAILTSFLATEPDTTFSAITPTTIKTYPAVMATGNDQTDEVIVLCWQIESGYVLMVGGTDINELEIFMDYFYKIADNVSYTK